MDRPIIFSPSMIRALLREANALGSGKRQTRRIAKPVPLLDHFASEQLEDFELRGFEAVEQPDGRHLVYRTLWQVADRLWVKENWRAPAMNDEVAPRDLPAGIARVYEADGAQMVGAGSEAVSCPIGAAGRLRPSIHMPRALSRLTLIVTEVKVERLRDISEENAVAEGVGPAPGGWFSAAEGQSAPTAKAAFALLWNSIHGPAAWAGNPWIAAITFQAIRQNIDSLDRPVSQSGGAA